MSHEARIGRQIAPLRHLLDAGSQHWAPNQAPAWYQELESGVTELIDEAASMLGVDADELAANWDPAKPIKFMCGHTLDPKNHPSDCGGGRWQCGCLVNEAGAHRVGCPVHPLGIPGYYAREVAG